MIDPNDVVLAQRCKIFLRASVGYLTDRDSARLGADHCARLNRGRTAMNFISAWIDR